MLKGVRIIEIEGLGPGPFAGMLLADLGADVIVAHRKGGSSAPGMPEQSLIDRGKRSITVDLKDPDDLDLIKALISSADGLIEGFRPGVMEKLGLGPQICQGINPALVYGRVTGWGQNGPQSHAAGHDLNYIAMSGAAWFASEPGQPPFTPPTLVGDIGGGSMYLTVGMLAGILAARTTGQGTVVDAAVYDGSAHMMNLLLTMRQPGLLAMDRGQSLLDGPHWSRCYRTSDDGYISVQCLEPKFYALFLDLLNLSGDPEFQRQFDRALWPVLTKRLAAVFQGKTREAWTAIFQGTDACVAPVLNPEEALHDPLNAARATWHDVGGVLQAAPAPRFSDQPPWTPPKTPVRGEHNDEIRKELGARR